jgi:predicted amidohydrolase YtcJ
VRACGHISIVNSLALSMAGIDETTPCRPAARSSSATASSPAFCRERPRGDSRGDPQADDEGLVAAIERAGLFAEFRHHERDGRGGRQSRRISRDRAYRTAQRTGRLPVRTNSACSAAPRHRRARPCRRAS